MAASLLCCSHGMRAEASERRKQLELLSGMASSPSPLPKSGPPRLLRKGRMAVSLPLPPSPLPH